MPPTLMPLGNLSIDDKYSPYVSQSQRMPVMIDLAGMSSTDSIRRARNSRSSGLQGAKVTPQLPITTEVTPCQHGDVASGSQEICASR